MKLKFEAPKGVMFKLWNKYNGRNVYGTGCSQQCINQQKQFKTL